jgi:DNA-binding transcriptional MerR regulator
MTTKTKFVTLLEMSKVFKVKKATLTYYTQLGLFVPDMIAGKTALFEEGNILKTWDKIQRLRKENTLSQIREIFAKDNANKKR